MITDKVTHLINFTKNKLINNDSLANEVILNTNLINQRSTALDIHADKVVLNLRTNDHPINSYFFSDDCGHAITRLAAGVSTVVISPTVTRNGYPAINFSGGDDQLLVSYSSELNLQGVNFTVEGWARVDRTSGNAILVDFRGTNNVSSNWTIGVEITNWRIFILDSGTYNYAPNNSIVQGTWFHFAVCNIDTTCTVYINGISVLSFSWVTPATHTSGVSLGLDAPTYRGFNRIS